FRYIMVDEYQDTNHAQYTITKMLAELHENICVVGDDAQSIYSFRGANIKNILNFQADYPKTQQFKLERNYRSTKNIVGAANSIIGLNKGQIQKTVYTENASGELIQVIEASTEQEESKQVTDQVREQKMRLNFRNKDFAVLYRTNAQSRAIETELRRAGIRYKVFGGLSFYRRKEIKDITSYLKLAINPKDQAALLRVINYPARGIGKTSLDRLTVAADNAGIGLWEALCNAERFPELGRARKAFSDFVLMVKTFGIKAREENAYETANFIAKQCGILKDLHQHDDVESLSRWENVQELLNAAKEYSEDPDNDAHSLDAFLAEISLFTDQDEKHDDLDFVSLMSIHAAKGLEFPSIFVVGLEEQMFPSFMSLQSRADLEEERRLFYVAVTRAKDRLTISFAKSRYRYGTLEYNEPSRFVAEIDDQFINYTTVRRSRPAPSWEGIPVRSTNESGTTGRSLPKAGSRLPMGRKAPRLITNNFEGDDLTNLEAGMKVEHSKFGEGEVMNVEGKDNEKKATVFFTKKGQKVLLLKYAKLKILA
ncbi:MAG TPA: ATP-dependent DNA helicase, partial [Bacteroidetes bacterium]|nr:ATP-dependent DNA helicase [Bacteroidota bacterium]